MVFIRLCGMNLCAFPSTYPASGVRFCPPHSPSRLEWGWVGLGETIVMCLS